LVSDTGPEFEARLVDAWRAMTPSQKLSLAVQMSRTVRQLAMAGVRQRHPGADPREQFLRLAVVTLGEALARPAYPELDGLDRP